MKNKFIIIAITCCLSIFSLVRPLPAQPENKRTLHLVVHQWMLKKYLIEKAALNFESNHPDVRVTVDTMSNVEPRIFLSDWLNGNIQTDLIFGWSAAEIKEYIKHDLLASWNIFLETGSYPDRFVESFLDLGKVGDVQYVIPMVGEVMTVVVRQDLMEKAGLTDHNGIPIPPVNWEELYNYAEKLTIDINGDGEPEVTGLCMDWGDNFMTQNYIYGLKASQGTIYQAGSKMLDFNSSNAQQMLRIWQRGIKDGYFSTSTLNDENAGRKDFKKGKVAMLVTAHSRWIECKNELIVPGEVTIMPILAGNKGALIYMHGIWSPKKSANMDIARQFVAEEILKDDYFLWTALQYGKLPPLQTTYKHLKDPLWFKLLKEAQLSAVIPPYTEYAMLDKIVIKEFRKLLFIEQSPESALDNIRRNAAMLNLSID